MLSGLAAGVLAAALVALAPSSGGVWALIGASAPLGLTARATPAMTAVAIGSAPGHRIGLASGVLNAKRQTGSAFGVAVLGALFGHGGVSLQPRWPEPVATTTPARYARSAGPGVASYGSAGKTACHMTLPATAPRSNTSQSLSLPRRAVAPTSLPPSGSPALLSPEARPARAERAALDPQDAIRYRSLSPPHLNGGVDTGRLLSPRGVSIYFR